MEEHQHQLAHQCSPNIIGIWEWGICRLNGWGIYHLMCGAFMAYWVGLNGGSFISPNGWGICHLMSVGHLSLNGWGMVGV